MVDSEKDVKEKFRLADRFRLEPLIIFFVNKNSLLLICFSCFFFSIYDCFVQFEIPLCYHL
ncbi:unnamed protein product [Caenorhabditis brenneri]